MATKTTLVCDRCKKNKKETEAVGCVKLWMGTWVDYDRTKDDYRDIDLCVECMGRLLQDLASKLPKEEQEKLYFANGGSGV